MADQAAPHSNLFIGNLNADANEETLKSFFASATQGQVESCRVVKKDGKTSGFVKMADVASAQRAIENINGQNGLVIKFANFDVGGKQKIYGGKASGKGWGKGAAWGKGGWGWAMQSPKLLPRDSEPEKPEGPASENLYVKHWPVGVTEDEVKATFQKVGEVAECRLLRPDTSLEWAALVRMSSQEQAARARQSVDETFPAVNQQPLIVHVQTKNGQPKEDHCYVKNVPSNTTKEKITALFSKYGEVKWCDVLAPRGWKVDASGSALVEMGSPEECQKAIAALNDQTVPFADIGQTIRVRYALNKEKPAEASS